MDGHVLSYTAGQRTLAAVTHVTQSQCVATIVKAKIHICYFLERELGFGEWER